MKKGCPKNILKAEHSPGLSPAASALHSKKKRSLQKKVTCNQCLPRKGEKEGREGMSPFHYTRPVTVCADTGIHKKKGDFGNVLKQII